VAEQLGMQQVYLHTMAGVLSAYGMGLADQTASRQQQLERPLDAEGLQAAHALTASLGHAAQAELEAQGVPAPELRPQWLLRYAGTDTALPCPPGTEAELRTAFEAAYRQRYAFLLPGRGLVIESVTVEARSPRVALSAAIDAAIPEHHPAPLEHVPCFHHGWRAVPLFQREALTPGAVIDGPAVIAERNATTVVEPGWQARVSVQGLVLTRLATQSTLEQAASTTADPVRLEVFNHLFMNIAEQMGLRLQNTASSVNIKERLDFSCALFDGAGQLIANAPHMPVHLGSMSESIRSVIERNPGMRPGDVFVLNDPYHGGTHLPDITVVTPVWIDAERPAFYVASRGHHADVGGITPGSMPPFSRSIADEGVLLDNVLLATGGQMREAEMRALLEQGPHPARNPDQNLADLRAQIAANEKGVQELQALVAHWGLATVQAYMQHVQDNAEEAVRRAISRLQDGSFRLRLDNGAEIAVSVRVDTAARSATIDFSGTSRQQPNNFNAPRAITTAAVLYVFRALVDDDIPLNAGS
jgi:5-oxoprolinase (ATP-hydrolysing)